MPRCLTLDSTSFIHPVHATKSKNERQKKHKWRERSQSRIKQCSTLQLKMLVLGQVRLGQIVCHYLTDIVL